MTSSGTANRRSSLRSVFNNHESFLYRTVPGGGARFFSNHETMLPTMVRRNYRGCFGGCKRDDGNHPVRAWGDAFGLLNPRGNLNGRNREKTFPSSSGKGRNPGSGRGHAGAVSCRNAEVTFQPRGKRSMVRQDPTHWQVLHLLKEQGNDFLSGTILASRLGLTRTAVWKHIQNLRGMGYDIQSHSKEGYRLLNVPDLLIPEEIVPGLKTRWLGRFYHHFPRISSTNDHALLLAAQGAPHGTVVVAEEQTHGRGRLKREWLSVSQKGSIFPSSFGLLCPFKLLPRPLWWLPSPWQR